MRPVLLVLLCFFAVAFAGAQTLVLTNSTASYDVSKYLRYSVGLNPDQTIGDIKSESTHWQTFKNGETPNMGVKKEAYWFTFTMQNNSDQDDWILHINYWTLDDVSVFVYDSNTGALLFSDKQGILTKNTHQQRAPIFPLMLSKNAQVRVYLRVQSCSLLIVPLVISTPLAFNKIENAQLNVYLPALGILLAAFLFNLVLLITSREKGFLFLLFSIAAALCFMAAITGSFYETIVFDHPVILQKLRFISAGFTYGFQSLFVVQYLNLKNHKRIWQIEIWAITGCFLYSLLAGTGILSPHVSGLLLVPTNIISFIIQFSIAVYLFWKKAPMARYYMFSFLPPILASLLYIAVIDSWIEPNLFYSNSALYASALFTVFLTSGFTEKMIKVKHEKARANQLEIDKIALQEEIIQRITAEMNLKASQIRFHSLFELSPLPVILTEFESGKIVDANLAIYGLTGLHKEALLGRTIYDLGFMEVTKRDELIRILSRNEQILAHETILNINGKSHIVHFFMSLLNIGNEKFIITLISDVSKQKETEQQLKELNLTKDKFFSIIAHDLVNPFHAMILYSKELKVFTAGNERAASYNTNLLLTAQNTYNLLQNLLTWSRSQAKQISFNPQLINLGDLIAENVLSASQIAKSKQIEILNEASHELLIEADIQMINLILRNLLSNSIKFSFNQGIIRLVSNENESEISISVIDQGMGMELDEIEKLFDLFETSQRPGTAGEAGTGLGLVICNEFVNWHGGSIRVESEAGKGSTFKITIPKKQK